MTDQVESTEVLIVGCGPTGAMMSGYLGQLGVSNIVIEKESDINTDPRGIALDDDGIRLVQGLGLYEHIFTEIGSTVSKVRFVSGNHHNLNANPFLVFDTGSIEGHTSHVGVLSHKQPTLEKYLRTAVDKAETSELRNNCTLTSISEDADWVYATYNESSTQRKIRAKFLAAADGKTGFTRKNYLEPKGIRLDWAGQTKYQETWVALNWKMSLPSEKTHPDFPLWNLGYTPQQVYDLFFPEDFRFLCNPERPAVCGRFGRPEDRLWRFEFVVSRDEDGMELAKPARIRQLVHPYLKHEGSRYGLKEDVSFPEDCIEVLRCRPFNFSARSCNKWALGRVILCGDAAHVFPPFGGQGIASGFRDAISIAWRLAIACSPGSKDHARLFEGWYLERKQQLDESLAKTVKNGDMVNGKNPIQIFLRDWGLWALQLLPFWKHWIERGPRSDGPTRYRHYPGMPMHFMPDLGGGEYFPQTFCIGFQQDAVVQFTDDVIFGGKTKMFQIVVLLSDPHELDAAICELDGIDRFSNLLSQDEATFFVSRSQCARMDQSEHRLFRTATGDEFGQSSLCACRPHPHGYDETLIWKSVSSKRYVILRYDRFVFALCNTRAELEKAATQMTQIF
ncbi:monooxygenase [Penicillium odoratum]|uniref:monooxygenase n=1 Tax=Penicillium odoratum TaxID=1167516 RepID=UPI002547186C|nr:monooxygenase [Penicillium odoratum]KAJ5769581.1 monooxygenase [Penicillium odoratum]